MSHTLLQDPMPPIPTMGLSENTGTTCLLLPQPMCIPTLIIPPLPRLLPTIQLLPHLLQPPKPNIMPTMKITPTTLPHIMQIPLPQLPQLPQLLQQSTTLPQMLTMQTIQTTQQFQTQAKTHQPTSCTITMFQKTWRKIKTRP